MDSRENNILRAEYDFIPNFKLVAILDKESKEKFLEIEYIKNGQIVDFTKIKCIHTALATFKAEDLQDLMNYESEDDALRIIYSQSSEGMQKQINLPLEEDFFALKSWVEGIATWKEKAFLIQREIEDLARFTYPLSFHMLNFIAKYNENVFLELINYILKECKIGNKWHAPSLKANLLLIKAIVDVKISTICEKIKFLESINAPSVFYWEFLYELCPIDVLMKLEDFGDLFDYNDKALHVFLARSIKTTESEHYQKLFNSKNLNVLRAIAQNPFATRFKEFKQLFSVKDTIIQIGLAQNVMAPKFMEFKKFFCIIKKEILKKSKPSPFSVNIAHALVKNPKATLFKDFSVLFSFNDLDTQKYLASHTKFTCFKEFKNLFNSKYEEVLIVLAKNKAVLKMPEFEKLIDVNIPKINRIIAKVPEAVKAKGFAKLFYQKDFKTLLNLANNQKAAELNDYRILFVEILNTNSISTKNEIRKLKLAKAIAKNINATRFKEYKELFKHPNWGVRLAIKKNKTARLLKEFQQLIPLEFGNTPIEVALNKFAPDYEEYKFLFDESESIRFSIASNPYATKWPQFQNLFVDSSYRVRARAALNPNAPNLPNYKILFKDPHPFVVEMIAYNPNAKKFDEYKQIKQNTKKNKNYSIPESDKIFFIYNIVYPSYPLKEEKLIDLSKFMKSINNFLN
ncbi:MAG: hypothetical protein ACTSRZ_03480 [Promethearchaeota archaeon]